MKIKYPRTPRSKWATIKITKKMVKHMREMRAAGYSYELIAREYGVSRSGVRRHLVPKFKKQLKAWAAAHPGSTISSPETRRAVYAWKLKFCGKKFRSYQNQFKKS